MAEHDYVIANQNGANTRSDLNNALAAIVSNNSKATAPTTTYAFMWWADTANDILKQRNGADSAWISILTLSTGAPLATIANFTSTGIDDNATSTAITIDASENVEINTGNLVIGTSGKGIDFSANGNAGGMTSEVLDDYEEGTWTPALTLAGGTGSLTTASGIYTKIGNTVTVHIKVQFGTMTSAYGVTLGALPFNNLSVSSTKPSVSGRGINTFLSTIKMCPKNSCSPVIWAIGSPLAFFSNIDKKFCLSFSETI